MSDPNLHLPQQQQQHHQQQQLPPGVEHPHHNPMPELNLGMPGGGGGAGGEQHPLPPGVAQAPPPVVGGDDGGVEGGDSDPIKDENGGSRRFFPRVKQLVNPEWEHFLQGVLHSVQAHQAHATLKASGVDDNAWYQVFHAVYGGFASDSCSVPQGKNRYHKFKDKIVELWRYMAVTDPPEHDINGRLWKMGRGQWEMYKSLLVVAGKSPLEIQMETMKGGVAGSPGKGKKKGRGKAAATISRSMPIMHHYETSAKKNYLPSPLHELHHVWKMSFKRGDAMEMGFIRKDYTNNIRSFAEESSSGPDTPTRLLWTLEGLNELREIDHEAEIKKVIADAYANVLQRYLMALNRKKGLAKK